VLLTGVTAAGVAVAEGALASADRDAGERRAAATAADGLVAADGPASRRENVLDRAAVESLTAADVEAAAPPVAGTDLRVRIGGEIRVERGDPDGGTTVRRLALLAETEEWTTTTNATRDVTVPRRTDELTIRVDPEADVETVRVDGRIVLHDPAGIENATTVAVPRYDTLTVSFEGTGEVTVRAAPETTTKALVEVTVDV